MTLHTLLCRSVAAVLSLAGLGCCLFSSGPRDFQARFEGRVVDFNCEVQSVHRDATPMVRPIPPGAGPSGRMMGLDPGRDMVVWLYHFEDDGSVMRDEEYAYSIAVSLKTRDTGTFDFPCPKAAVQFFCDNWGRGFKACEAQAVEGWLRLEAVTDRSVRGDFNLVLKGFKEKADKTREDITMELRGRFEAVP